MISRRPFLASVLAVLCVTLAGSRAQGAIPDPFRSTVDPCIRVCPAGDMNFHVVVRDALNNPRAGSTVLINFGNCSGVTLCPAFPGDPYTFVPPNSIQMTSNGEGVADFPIRAGGVCVGSVMVYADGVQLAVRGAVSSPDQNGDLVVNATDSGILGGKLGSSDPTGDLNCSGVVEAGDTGILLAHGGHSCQAVVPVKPGSWGKVKIHYR